MIQQKALKIISDEIINQDLALALYLKGSMAEKTDDEYSDVDLYCILKSENIDLFFDRIIDILEKYMPLIFVKKVVFNIPKIIAIFENGLEFDIYIEVVGKTVEEGKIAIIHDPLGVLKNYSPKPLGATNEEIGKNIEELCFALLTFEKNYKRGDLIFCYRVVSHLVSYLGTFLRQIFDPDNAKKGLKGIDKVLPDEYYDKYLEIVKKQKFDTLLDCAKMIVVLLDGFVTKLPLEIAMNINFDLYDYAKKIILVIY